MAAVDYIVLERRDRVTDRFPFSVLKTSKDSTVDAFSAVEIGRFVEKKTALDFCRTWNGTTNQ